MAISLSPSSGSEESFFFSLSLVSFFFAPCAIGQRTRSEYLHSILPVFGWPIVERGGKWWKRTLMLIPGGGVGSCECGASAESSRENARRAG